MKNALCMTPQLSLSLLVSLTWQGLVEKWLKEVQTIMLESVLTQMKAAYDGYWTSKRNEWIMKWCGQFVQTVSRTTWTKEVNAFQCFGIQTMLVNFSTFHSHFM